MTWRLVLVSAAVAAGFSCASAGAAPPRNARTVLAAEPGRAPATGILIETGVSRAGEAAGRFDLEANLQTRKSRLTIISGGVADSDGWDGRAWSAHDQAVVPIDLPGAVADARAEAFLRSYGWRDQAGRRSIRLLGGRQIARHEEVGVAITPTGASTIQLWFDSRTHRLSEAVIAADMGSLSVKFADWRRVGKSDYAFWRERRDATGQTQALITEQASIVAPHPLPRPADVRRGQSIAPSTVPFQFDHGDRGHIVVDANIDQTPVKLVFDTGAANYLTPEAAQRLNLKVAGGLNVGGVGEASFAGGFARIATLAIGSVRLLGSSTIIAPLPEAAIHPRPGLELAGLAGFEFLHAFKTTIDYGARTITFDPFGQDDRRTEQSLPYTSDGQGFFIRAAVNGHPGWFRLDTGDAGTVTVFGDFAARNALRGSGTVNKTGEAGGNLKTTSVRFDTLAIAGLTFRSVISEISGQQAGAFASKSAAGNLGSGILSCFRFTIDQQLRRVALDLLPRRMKPTSCQLDVD